MCLFLFQSASLNFTIYTIFLALILQQPLLVCLCNTIKLITKKHITIYLKEHYPSHHTKQIHQPNSEKEIFTFEKINLRPESSNF